MPPLETGTYISDLNASNPVGSTDKVQTLDDHVRLIKSTVKATFPNVTGAVTATQGQLNVLATDGAGAGMLADIAAIADPGADRVLGWDESANAAIAFSFSTGLTSSGTAILIDTTVVPQLGAANTFTANITISNASPALIINETDGDNASWVQFQDNSVTRAYVASANATDGLISGAAQGDLVLRSESGGLLFSGNGGTTLHVKLDSSGVLTTPNTSASEVGYKGVPSSGGQTGNYTLVLTDAGKFILYTGSGGHTLTIPAQASVNFPVGTVITLATSGTAGITVAITTDSLFLAGAGTSGSRTLAAASLATIIKVASQTWYISGAGVS